MTPLSGQVRLRMKHPSVSGNGHDAKTIEFSSAVPVKAVGGNKRLTMKKIEVIVRPFKLDVIHHFLGNFTDLEFTVIEVQRIGWQRGDAKAMRRNDEYPIDCFPYIKIEIILYEEQVSAVTAAIAHIARNESYPCADIFTLSLERTIPISGVEH